MPSSGIGILGARGVARLTSLQKLDIGYSHIGSQVSEGLEGHGSLLWPLQPKSVLVHKLVGRILAA